MKYLYESHLGGIYVTNNERSNKELFCPACGDSDWLIGPFETIEDLWSLIKDDCDIEGCGGWSLQYIYPMIVDIFDLPDIIEYENDYERERGICDHSDAEIIARIEELIKEESNDIS